MADNVLIATANDANGAHQKVVNEYLDANGLPVSVSVANPLPVLASVSTAGLATSVGQTAGNTSLSSINGKLPSGLTVTANRLQVELPLGGTGLTNTELRATPLPVSITGGGDATAANQTTEIAKLTSIDGKTPALGQALAIASTPVVLTEVQLSALTPTPAISGFATSAKQDLLLTELQLKADLTETQPVSVTALPLPTGAATSANQQTDALTNTQLRATPIPVSITSDIQIGAVELKNATTDDRVAIINVTPTIEFGVVTRNIPSGTQAVSALSLPLPSGAAIAANQQTNAITNTEIRATALPVSLTSTTITGSVAVTGGLTDTQIRATALPISGTVSISNLNPAIETGLAKDVTLTGGTQKSILRTATKGTTTAGDTTSTNIDVNTQALDVSVKGGVSVSNFPATQPISGTVTANTGLAQPLTNTEIRLTPLPISGTVSTGGLTDTQIRATPLPISGVVSANATLSAETTKVIGTVNIAGTVPISGALTDSQIRATPLPVSGSITSNIGTTNGLALDATLTNGNQKSILRTATKGTTPAADTTSSAIDVNTQALDVAVKNNVSVTGTFFQTTQPVSLTSTTVTNTVAVSATSLPLPTGAATAANQQTNAITDLQIRATPLPISGTVSTGGLTDTQIRATALPISGIVTANIGTTNGLALDTSVNTLLKPASTLAAVTSITNAVTIKADTALNQTNALKTDGSATTQPISATTLPLPSGASTATLQGTGNTSLGSIDTKLPTGLTVTANRLLVELPAGGTGLTNTELRATAVPVSLTSTTITGSVAITGGLTDTQIRATPLPVLTPAEGLVSLGNSTVVNLAANAVFTGAVEDITLYSNVKINVYSSHVSAIDGLSYQFSHNGILWIPSDVYSIPALTLKSFSIGANMKFFRVVYTNGATTTTELVIQVLYHKSDKQPASVRPQDGRSNDNDFEETLGFMMGYNSIANAWNRVGVTSGNLGGNETLIDRLKVNASLRMIDTAQPVGSQLVGATGTQALGLTVNTVDRAGRLLGVLSTGTNTIGAVNIAPAQTLATVTTVSAVTAITNALPAGTNSIGNLNELRASGVTVTATSVSGAAVTLTLPAVAGQFHYITNLQILIYATAARVGSATPVVVTTTNINGSPAFTFETAQAIGTNTLTQGFNNGVVKSAATGIATTIVCPIATTGIWRINVSYFTGV